MDGIEDKLQKLLNDPEALGAVMNMAKGLVSGGGEERGPSADTGQVGGASGLLSMLDGMDPSSISRMISIFGEYSRPDDRRTKLLEALKPYVREERREKMDKASQIVKLARTAGAALGSFKKEDT